MVIIRHCQCRVRVSITLSTARSGDSPDPYPKPGGIVEFFPSQKITCEKLTTLQAVQCVSSNVIGAPVGEPEMGVPITISQSKPGPVPVLNVVVERLR